MDRSIDGIDRSDRSRTPTARPLCGCETERTKNRSNRSIDENTDRIELFNRYGSRFTERVVAHHPGRSSRRRGAAINQSIHPSIIDRTGIRFEMRIAIVGASEIAVRGSARNVRRTTSRRGRRDDDESVNRTRDARDDDARVDGDDWIVFSGVVESGVGIEEEIFAEDESTITPRWKLGRGAGARKTRGDCGCGERGTMYRCGRERKAWTRRDVDSSGGIGIRGSNGRRR